MTRPRPSAIRVLHKSLHLLSAGWFASVWWLWLAQIEQSLRRVGAVPDDYAAATLIVGTIPVILVEICAVLLGKWMVTAPGVAAPAREWHHAFWWTLVPNLMLLGTAYLMILEGS
jgi:hypothetical protein